MGPMLPRLSRSFTDMQNTQNFTTKFYNFAERANFAEHWKLVAESSEFHLTLGRPHIAHCLQHEIRQRKRDNLREKRESGMVLKKLEFTPESGTMSFPVYGVKTVIAVLHLPSVLWLI